MRLNYLLCAMLFHERAIIRLETIDSTNNYAANLVRLSQPPEGTVITAQEQSAGKGQRNSNWESHSGENLLCSVILYPKFLNASNQFCLSQAIALAVQEIIEKETTTETYIKWPNDIIVNDKKIAGILIENTWTNQRLGSSVIGIGINVNQTSFDTLKATSVRRITGKSFDIEACLLHLIQSLEKYYFKLQAGGTSEIVRHYLGHLYRINQVTDFLFENQQIRASIIGVDQSGRLKLRTESGPPLTCDLKEISMIL